MGQANSKMNSKQLETIKERISPIVKKRELMLWDVSFFGAASPVLTILIDRQDKTPITMNEISEITPFISEAMDQIEPDPFPDHYNLDISSPGIDRTIKSNDQLAWAVSEPVKINFFEKIDGQKNAEGILLDYSDSYIELKNSAEQIEDFPRDKITKISLNQEV